MKLLTEGSQCTSSSNMAMKARSIAIGAKALPFFLLRSTADSVNVVETFAPKRLIGRENHVGYQRINFES